jgi:3-oxoacyl-[acyl-carrier-protein] synthase-1
MSLREGRTALRPLDLEWISPMSTWIGRVPDLESVRIPARLAALDSRNNRLAHLCLEQDDFRKHVSSAIKRHGNDRIGVFIGTTTSGILDTELAYRAWAGAGAAVSRPDLQRSVHNMHATTAFARRHLGLRGPAQTVSTACSSSAKVFASARRFMEAGLCSAAVVGGVDSLALSTLAGFKALNLVSSGPCRPFDALRDGISIGEGAGFALLDPSADAAISLLGVGESSDAWHMSSPHPEGAGAALAMRMALKEAGLDPSEVGYVNLHGTASRANDLAEDRAITAVFGTKTPVSSTKGFTGHTLGAAGITEAVITAMALADQWIPGTVNCDAVDRELGAALVKESRSQAFATAMSNSFGFGGTNCSLLFGRTR